MAFDDFNIDVLQDYLQSLCESNKDVQHLKIVAPAVKAQHAFARFESEEHIAAIKNCGAKNIVVVADYYGQRVGDADDYRTRLTVQIRFAVRRLNGTGNVTEAINDAVTKAEDIMFQFIAKMDKDFREGCNALEAMEPERITWDKIEEQPWLDDYYGWDLNLSFGSYMPPYDENDWEI